ncbi:hypothetical protein MBRA_36740 [Mycobacterium branderi]|uniref:Uncharacterized protein n=1 Tax=Mycobacterium branderi TaxID=43348 RepID=A0ABM7KQV5_9MYCO|nr:hypothetical protein MBRA_36740 [Mycobacterium branderi]
MRRDARRKKPLGRFIRRIRRCHAGPTSLRLPARHLNETAAWLLKTAHQGNAKRQDGQCNSFPWRVLHAGRAVGLGGELGGGDSAPGGLGSGVHASVPNGDDQAGIADCQRAGQMDSAVRPLR